MGFGCSIETKQEEERVHPPINAKSDGLFRFWFLLPRKICLLNVYVIKVSNATALRNFEVDPLNAIIAFGAILHECCLSNVCEKVFLMRHPSGVWELRNFEVDPLNAVLHSGRSFVLIWAIRLGQGGC